MKRKEEFISSRPVLTGVLNFFKLISLCICLFLAAAGLHGCSPAPSRWGELGLLFTAVCGVLSAASSLVGERGLQ